MMKIIRSQNARSAKVELTYGWVALALFAAAIAILGGSSRTDVVQLVGLRPAAALFLIPALFFLSRQKLARLRPPVIFLGLLTIWTALQLVPLPAGVWQSLPGREPITALGQQLGQADVWRPVSMVPSRTLNALAGLIVPVTGLLLIAAMGAGRRTTFAVLIGLGALNAMLGIAQVVAGPESALYFYSVTNAGSAVGFFANHNHSAVFSAIILVTIAYFATDRQFRIHHQLHRLALGALFLLLLVVALIGGSRAGFLTTILALCTSGTLFWNRWRTDKTKSGTLTVPYGIKAPIALGFGLLGIAGMVALFVMFDRIPALSRVTEATAFEDLRWDLIPVLREMVSSYWLLGSGFGSFEEVYHIHEPAELMFSSYVNQAHNDLAQLAIEGGLPALLILAGFAGWLIVSLRRIFKSNSEEGRSSAATLIFWLAVLTMIVFASLFDYPLRAPLFQMIAVWLVAAFAMERSVGV
ncbi:hypothetical protein GCM10023115_03800 [Pontixanthobacter gangjinensis]|uniref:O-antigen ligase-related domain-containing protein n=1 Tax=Pontixanthobacter gangjinensis TaxID=1028742 RepID=A0A6I4SJ03_9SPHN|nr:O-antigen ligase family protein [Pontixanthobacter gangjinensis]MXO55633.1 hypothetical protein [Pontixanthobacter gangjinensis]